MEALLHSTATFAAFIFITSLKASALITLVLLAQKALGRYLSANGHYLLWLPVLLSLLTPVGFKTVIPQSLLFSQQLVLPVFNPVPAHLEQAVDKQVSVARPFDNPEFAQALPAPPAAHDSPGPQTNALGRIDRLNLLSLTWLAGVLLLLGIILFRSFRFSQLVRRALPANPALQNLLAVCCEQTNCKATVRLLVSPDIETPLVTGCFSPVLLLPEHVEHLLSTTQLRHVFLHELMHVKRGDIAGNWLLTLLQCLHWFNPLVWFALTRLRNDRELVCDAGALHHLGPQDGAAYGHTLLQLCQPRSREPIATHGIGMVGTKAELRRRIAMVVQTSFPNRFESAIVCLFFLAFGGLAFSKPVVETASTTSGSPMPAIADVAAITQPAPAVAMPVPEQNTTTASSSLPTPSSPATRVEKNQPAATGTTVTNVSAKSSSTAAAAGQDAGKTVATAVIAMMDTKPQNTATPAVEIATVMPPEVWSGSAAMSELTRSISKAKAAGLKFISQWNTTADACTDIPGQHRRRIPCQLVKNISNNNQLYDFKLQCAALADKYNQLARDYSATAAATLANRETIAATMLRNYQDLTQFCSAQTYNKQYPAFAKLFNSVTANWDMAMLRKSVQEGLMDTTFMTGSNNSGSNYSYSPVERNDPNPADYGISVPGTGSSGTGSSGASSPGAGSSGGSSIR